MNRIPNLTGQRFNMLVVIRPGGRAESGAFQWLCKCDCGKEATIRHDNLVRGAKSCGCIRRKHGMSLRPAMPVYCACGNLATKADSAHHGACQRCAALEARSKEGSRQAALLKKKKCMPSRVHWEIKSGEEGPICGASLKYLDALLEKHAGNIARQNP